MRKAKRFKWLFFMITFGLLTACHANKKYSSKPKKGIIKKGCDCPDW